METPRKIFVETTVVSLLVARRSKDASILNCQVHTRAWWRRRNDYTLYSSTGVRDEAVMGDEKEAAKRLAVIHTMIPLEVTPTCVSLAEDLLQRGILPSKARIDALHLTTAMVHGMDVVLSWNFKHLVNPHIVRQLYQWGAKSQYNVPVVCTPESLLRASHEY